MTPHLHGPWLCRRFGPGRPGRRFSWFLVVIASAATPMAAVDALTRECASAYWVVVTAFAVAAFAPAMLYIVLLLLEAHVARTRSSRTGVSGDGVGRDSPSRASEPEDWAWLVWTTEVIVATSIGFGHFPRSQHIEAAEFVAESMPKLMLASATGILVLFFVHFIARYDETIDRVERAGKQLDKLKEFQMDARTMTNAAVAFRDRAAVQDVQRLLRHLSGFSADPTFSQAADEFTAEIEGFHLTYMDMGRQGSSPPLREDIYTEERVALAAFYVAYRTTERLSFGRGATPGPCRFTTRFEHYALAVRMVERQLLRLSANLDDPAHLPQRASYEFVALSTAPFAEWLTRSMDPISGHVSPDWLIFLERFVMWNRIFGVRWTRLFVQERPVAPPPGRGQCVLCRKVRLTYPELRNKEDHSDPDVAPEPLTCFLPVVSWNGLDKHRNDRRHMWSETGEPNKIDQLLTAFAERVEEENAFPLARSIVESLFHGTESATTTEPLIYVRSIDYVEGEFWRELMRKEGGGSQGGVRYKKVDQDCLEVVVTHKGREKGIKLAVLANDHTEANLDYGDLAWVPLERLVRDTYHGTDSAVPSRVGVLDMNTELEKLMPSGIEATPGTEVPRDLFAVRFRDERGARWVLCMGALTDHTDLRERGLVDLVYSSPLLDRKAWAPIGAMLDGLFPPDGGATKFEVKWLK